MEKNSIFREINNEYDEFVEELKRRELREKLLLEFDKEALNDIEESIEELFNFK